MRRVLLATAMFACPGVAAAGSQCAVTKAAEPFISLPAPVDVTGRPVPLTPRSPSQNPTVQEASGRSSEQPGPDLAQPLAVGEASDQVRLSEVPVLRHVADAGATLVDIGVTHGLRTVVARHAGELMIFQVASDGQAAVAGLMTDLSVDQLKAVSGSALTELPAQHGLRSFFLRNGARFQVFYATPDNQRVVPGVMWDATGQDVTRKAIASIPGAVPTVTVGEAAANPRVTSAIATSSSSSPVSFSETAYGTSGNPSAPQLWILTTAGNAVMRSVHDRMPVILEPADWSTWLGEAEGELDMLLLPSAEEVLRLWPVSTSVNSVRNNGADLLKPLQKSEAHLAEAPVGGPNPA